MIGRPSFDRRESFHEGDLRALIHPLVHDQNGNAWVVRNPSRGREIVDLDVLSLVPVASRDVGKLNLDSSLP